MTWELGYADGSILQQREFLQFLCSAQGSDCADSMPSSALNKPTPLQRPSSPGFLFF
jgi:hypothetical protein